MDRQRVASGRVFCYPNTLIRYPNQPIPSPKDSQHSFPGVSFRYTHQVDCFLIIQNTTLSIMLIQIAIMMTIQTYKHQDIKTCRHQGILPESPSMELILAAAICQNAS